jgi:hypothetical protein
MNRARQKVNTSFSKPGAFVHMGTSVLCEATSRAVLTSSSSKRTPRQPKPPSV